MVEQENYHIFHLCIYTFPAINVHYCHYLYPVKTGFMVIGRYVESVIYDVPPHRLPITSPVNSLLVCICMRCTYWSPLCPPTTIISEGPTSRFLCTHFRWKLIFTSDSKNMHLWFSIQYNSRYIRRQTLVRTYSYVVLPLRYDTMVRAHILVGVLFRHHSTNDRDLNYFLKILCLEFKKLIQNDAQVWKLYECWVIV